MPFLQALRQIIARAEHQLGEKITIGGAGHRFRFMGWRRPQGPVRRGPNRIRRYADGRTDIWPAQRIDDVETQGLQALADEFELPDMAIAAAKLPAHQNPFGLPHDL